MSKSQAQKLSEAAKREKDLKVKYRILAVRCIESGWTFADVAYMHDVSEQTVRNWAQYYEEYGIEGLRDLSGRGTKPIVDPDLVEEIAEGLYRDGILEPKLLRKLVHQELGHAYSISQINKLLCKMGFSRARSTTAFENAADPKEVREWQKHKKRLIPRLKKAGYEIYIQDEAIFPRMGTNGYKY